MKKAPVQKINKLFEIRSTPSVILDQPSDVVVNSSGTIYAVDGVNNRVLAYDINGYFLFSFGKGGSGDGEFNAPVGIGISNNGSIYVADRGNRRVQFFNSKGDFKGKVDLSKKSVVPIDVAVDSAKGLLYITDNNRHRVVVYRVTGEFVTEWGQRGEQDRDFRYPATIWLEGKKVIIADALNSRAVVYSTTGVFIRKVGRWGVLPGEFFRPKGVAVDNKGNIYIADSFMDVIEVFNNEGRFLHVLADKSKNINIFTSPGGIFIKGNRLYVTEMLENRISVYSLK